MAFCESLATLALFVTCIWLTTMKAHSQYYKRPTSPWYPRENGITCTVWNQLGCPLGECCVKEVISFQDLDKNMLVSTRCKPLLAVGELCLREPEGYLCGCARGLKCEFQKNETYGHCAAG